MALRLTKAGILLGLFTVAGLVASAAFVNAQVAAPARPALTPAPLNQGDAWTPELRDAFYSKDQGSELIPLAWARALTRPDGSTFLGDQLARYGYLSNPASPDQLPVGFTTDTDATGVVHLGMTCAACHTREIIADNVRYRIDGAPALSDFQQFLTDLYQAISATLASPAAFDRFAGAVLGPGAQPPETSALRAKVSQWDQTQGNFFRAVLSQDSPWGVGRLDAVTMIFDRVSGLDIGNAPDAAAASLYKADAPVRYPFIWDAPMQNTTQWPGFAANGDNLLGLTRNLGEAYGVFANFHVEPAIIGHRYLKDNSAKIDNLIELEDMVGAIGAPKWPWPVNDKQRAHGATIFQTECAGCHDDEKTTTTRYVPLRHAWLTPLKDVGTDERERDILDRRAATGVLRGELLLPLGESARQFTLLQTVVVHTLLDQFHDHPQSFQKLFAKAMPEALAPSTPGIAAKAELKAAYNAGVIDMTASKKKGTNTYEAKRLAGIWAAAPYLHNGSVQSLAELLQPEGKRRQTFAVGPAFDRDAVGLAKDQPGKPAMRVTNGRIAPATGNGNYGHPYGTKLQPDDKRDLIEYLKTL